MVIKAFLQIGGIVLAMVGMINYSWIKLIGGLSFLFLGLMAEED